MQSVHATLSYYMYIPWMGNINNCPNNIYWPDINSAEYNSIMEEFARLISNHTMIHVNENDGSYYTTYLNTRNIFDYYTILQDKLFNYEYGQSFLPCPLEYNGWLDADESIEIYNSLHVSS